MVVTMVLATSVKKLTKLSATMFRLTILAFFATFSLWLNPKFLPVVDIVILVDLTEEYEDTSLSFAA